MGQNGFAEWLIESIGARVRITSLFLGEAHLRRILMSYARQKCVGFSAGSANREHQITRHPWRTSSLLRPSFKFSVQRFSIQTPVDVNCSQKKVAYVRARSAAAARRTRPWRVGGRIVSDDAPAVGERSLATSRGDSRGGLGSATAIG
jgi:hypothetical protein